jgi:hypothetical protein
MIADRVVVDEPLEFGDDLTGELVPREADDEDFDGREGHGELQLTGSASRDASDRLGASVAPTPVSTDSCDDA